MEPTKPDVARAWRRRARQLADHVFARWANRIDAWGAYVAPERRDAVGKRSWTAPPKQDRGKVELATPRLMAHFAAHDLGLIVGLHASSKIGTCRWGAIDIDRHGDPDDPTPEQTFDAAVFWFDVLVSLGFSPLLTDSNGTGGYHLRVFFNEPTPIARVYWFLQWLVRDHRARHIPKRPETYPRADRLPPAGFGNWLRLPGRHHTNADHWSRVWDGQRWLEGDEAIDAILACKGDPPVLIPDQAAPPKPRPLPKPVPLPDDLGKLIKRCEAYIARMPEAVSGARGHDRTFNVACEIFRFGLDGPDAKAVLGRYNARLGEQWNDEEIDHKLKDAKARVMADGEFGERLRDRRQANNKSKARLTIAPLRSGAST